MLLKEHLPMPNSLPTTMTASGYEAARAVSSVALSVVVVSWPIQGGEGKL